MNVRSRFTAPLLATVLCGSPAALLAQQYGQPQNYPPPQQSYPQQQGYPQQGQGYQPGPGGQWDAPPSEFSDTGRRAFHDGIQAAHTDFDRHLPLAFQRSYQYRHPPTPRYLRDDYRNGFQRGYQRAANRIMQGGPGGPPPPPPGTYPR